MKTDFSYEITEKIGVLSTSEGGKFTVEVNRISYNGAKPKLDIRHWNRTNDQMGKGITLTDQEAQELAKLLQR